jgi:hypothetical protein
MDWVVIQLSAVLLVCVAIWFVWMRKRCATVRNTAFWGMVSGSVSSVLALLVWILGREFHGLDYLSHRTADHIGAVGVFTALFGIILGIIKNRHTAKTWFVPVPVGLAMFMFWTLASGI